MVPDLVPTEDNAVAPKELTGDEAETAFAEFQLERELTARQKIARGAGLGLIVLSGVLEQGYAVLDRSEGAGANGAI